MEWLPRAEMSLEDSGAPIIIIDTSLALSPFGLLTTLRLAGAGAEVWLTPSLWRRLDEGSLERWHPMAKSEKTDAEQRAIITQWDCARLDLASKRLFWVADTVDESSLPKGVDAGVVARFDALKAALAAACDPDDDRVDDGELDSLILSAALVERPTAIFAIHEGETPCLVDAAKATGTISKKLSATVAQSLMQLWWRPLFLRAGLMELFATGALKLVCLRLIGPSALFLDTDLENEAAEQTGDWFVGAYLIWSAV